MSTALAPHRPPPRAALPLHMAARSAGGSRTPDNQDAYLALTAQGLFALSDGMGGHQGGRVASHLALDTLYAGLGQGTLSPPRITACIQRANERIVARAAQDPALEGMGATLVLAWIEGPWLHGFHIGDSRLYRLRAFRLERLTRDHSAGHGRLTRALGGGASVEIELHRHDWRPGDSLLLTSDGITDVLADVVLTNTLVAHLGAPAAQAEALIAAAEAAGGQDDKTLIVVES